MVGKLIDFVLIIRLTESFIQGFSGRLVVFMVFFCKLAVNLLSKL
jgi:hypothetical protein